MSRKANFFKMFREQLIKVEEYSEEFKFGIDSMPEKVAFACQIWDVLSGETVQTDIPDRQMFLTIVAVDRRQLATM